jgi:geranylgeranyl pyrophosphate synthase
MTPSELGTELLTERRGVEAALRRVLNGEKGVPPRLKQAMAHSLLAGGKRLRPLLLLWTWDAVTARRRRTPASRTEAMTAACALEMLHTYSLIHDDLPAMDDDDLRRGQPTCHVAFGEATAILAGDALQALGFSLLARSGGPLAGELVRTVADAVGPAGMVGGQIHDLAAEGKAVTAADVRRIHTGKTARLLMAAVEAGALLGGGGARLRESLSAAARELGLAFQGADDILDCTAAGGELGKTVGKDAAAGKATWVRVEGLAKAERRARRHGERGLAGLEAALPAGRHRDRLLALGRLLWNRDR